MREQSGLGSRIDEEKRKCKKCGIHKEFASYFDERFNMCIKCYYTRDRMFKHIDIPCKLPVLTRKNENHKRVYYDENNNRYHSVTNVVGHEDQSSLKQWRESVGYDVADYISRRAMNLGTKMHNMIESYLNNESIKEDNLFANAHFYNIKRYVDKIDNIYGAEIRLCSKELGLAGTADCIAEYDGVPSIIDFKTSSKKKKEDWILKYFLQTTAYSIMWEELTGQIIPQIVILITGEDGSLEAYVRDREDYMTELLETIKSFNIKQANDES